MVTLYDVARRAAVSTATVSRVVHGQGRVREATRIRVQQAIEELGYVPDGAGQSLSRHETRIAVQMETFRRLSHRRPRRVSASTGAKRSRSTSPPAHGFGTAGRGGRTTVRSERWGSYASTVPPARQ